PFNPSPPFRRRLAAQGTRGESASPELARSPADPPRYVPESALALRIALLRPPPPLVRVALLRPPPLHEMQIPNRTVAGPPAAHMLVVLTSARFFLLGTYKSGILHGRIYPFVTKKYFRCSEWAQCFITSVFVYLTLVDGNVGSD
ncbi:unnamed protein product, partial [Urochloa humidicola]